MGRFMESLLSLWRMHWDHEPWKAPASRSHSKRFAKSQALEVPAGAHEVKFVYADKAFRYGSLVSCLTVVTLAALLFQKGFQRTIPRTP